MIVTGLLRFSSHVVHRGGTSELDLLEGWMERNPMAMEALSASFPPAPGNEPEIFSMATRTPFGARWIGEVATKKRAILRTTTEDVHHHDSAYEPERAVGRQTLLES
jgi:hypothetical protein